MSLLALVSCKDSKNEADKTEVENVEQIIKATKDHHHEEVSDVYANSWRSEMKFNNGKKWEANAETNEGVVKMQNNVKSQSNTLEDYHKLAEQLNKDKNYVVKNCTMKGASHDNLHVWLLPLMAKIEALSETKTVEDAAKIKHSIEENINEYTTYFQ